MTDVMNSLVFEAKKNKFSTIGDSLSDDDIVGIWDNVSGFIERQMLQQKGVQIPGLGIFSFTQKKLDIGNNKYILIQRPIFILSEKFAQTHGLTFAKHHTTGQIPIIQLNFSALSFESPFDRDTVEGCVKEVLAALSRSVAAKRNVEFGFSGIGRLQIRDGKVKMKFYKDFLNSMDGSGKLVDALQNRPGTIDSVMSNRPISQARLNTSTLILPSISKDQLNTGLEPDVIPRKTTPAMPTIQEYGEAHQSDSQVLNLDDYSSEKYDEEPSAFDEVQELEEMGLPGILMQDSDKTNLPAPLLPVQSRSMSRVAVPMAQASGISLAEELMARLPSNFEDMKASPVSKSSPLPLEKLENRLPLSPPRALSRSQSLDRIQLTKPRPIEKQMTPPGTSCGHNAGQEICYLCHQRERRNIPVSFSEERKRREEEDDRLLQQYQHMKDTEAVLKEQANLLGKRHDSQKVAAFNLGVAEAVREHMKERPKEIPKAYIFKKRPLTPPRFIKQFELHDHLTKQVEHKETLKTKKKSDEEFLERLEQVQLAEDLAAQREQYLNDKRDQTEQYKHALSAQVRFKPVPLPPKEPDSNEPIFGKNDCSNEKLLEQRQRAHNVYKEQVEIVAQRKRDAILKRLQEQKDEEDMLKRVKQELIEDRADRYHRATDNRKRLEGNWRHAAKQKQTRETEDKIQLRSTGILVHEQCDKYKRCGQCKRRVTNCGESNIWSESRYIPGSRLIV